MNRVFAWPVGQGSSVTMAPQRFSLAYAAGAAIGGCLIGSCLGLVSAGVGPLSTEPQSILLLLASTSVLFEVSGRMGFFPERRAQVPRSWILKPGIWTAFRYGLMIGSGALTYLHHAAAYAVVLVLVAVGSPMTLLFAGLTFGTVRGLVPVAQRLLVHREEVACEIERKICSRTSDVVARGAIGTFGAAAVLLAFASLTATGG
jgi:hypothetical protein